MLSIGKRHASAWKHESVTKSLKENRPCISVENSGSSSLQSFDSVLQSELEQYRPAWSEAPNAKPKPLCKMSPRRLSDQAEEFERILRENCESGSPRVDLLLTLIQFNVFRALMSNNKHLGFGLEWLDVEAISPFNISLSPRSYESMPVNLRPTRLQHTVEHHPWIDLFPFPRLRDNLLLLGPEYDDTDICHDIVEIFDRPSEKAGLIVWGEPWNPCGWEVSMDFLEKWAWVVKGCDELLQSTNYWRERRGEPPIYF